MILTLVVFLDDLRFSYVIRTLFNITVLTVTVNPTFTTTSEVPFDGHDALYCGRLAFSSSSRSDEPSCDLLLFQ